MKYFLIAIISLLALSVNAQESKPLEELGDFPIIQFKQDTIDLGVMKEGEVKSLQFEFVNSGLVPLDIELVTACKCTSLSWPQEKVAPNGKGSIFVTFNSTGYSGEVIKVVDIISNTDPIVVEAWFKVSVQSED